MVPDSDSEKKSTKNRSKDPTSYTQLDWTIAWIVAFVTPCVLAVLFKMAQDGKFLKLAGKGIAKDATFSTKMEFSARYWILPLIWFKINIWLVIAKRVPSRAVNPLGGHERIVEAVKNVLTNSLEQLVASLLMQISLVSYLTGNEVVKYIPLINILFFVGRVTYFLGYPKFRTFGFLTTSIPTTVGTLFCVHQLLTKHCEFGP